MLCFRPKTGHISPTFRSFSGWRKGFGPQCLGTMESGVELDFLKTDPAHVQLPFRCPNHFWAATSGSLADSC